MKCCYCGKEILSNNNDESYSFYGGLGNKKLGECCPECSKLLEENLLKLRSRIDKYNATISFCNDQIN